MTAGAGPPGAMHLAVAPAPMGEPGERPRAAGLGADALLALAPLLHPVGDRRVAQVLAEEFDPRLLDRAVDVKAGAQVIGLDSIGQRLTGQHRVAARLRVTGELVRVVEPGLTPA